MYRFALLIVAVTLLSGSVAQAASYKKTDGTIVDPILLIHGSTLPYSGDNLEPYAILSSANLKNAYLVGADLWRVDLGRANLESADLSSANLEDADLYYANLYNADLTGADLTDAYLGFTDLDDATFSTGTTLYDGQTVLQHGYHDDPAGLEVYLKAPWPGISADSASNLTIVPEPASVFLLLTALLTLARVRF